MCFGVVDGMSEKATLKGCALHDCICVTCRKTSLVMEKQAVAAWTSQERDGADHVFLHRG